MTTDWKEGFQRALVDAIVREGAPHDPAASSFWGSSLPDNWVEIGPRVAEVGIDYANTPKPVEAEWTQFGGTFDGNDQKYGVDLELFLLDGTRTWYRYSGNISDLILAVVADEPCPGTGHRWTKTPGNRTCPTCGITARKLQSPTWLHQVPVHPKEG